LFGVNPGLISLLVDRAIDRQQSNFWLLWNTGRPIQQWLHVSQSADQSVCRWR